MTEKNQFVNFSAETVHVFRPILLWWTRSPMILSTLFNIIYIIGRKIFSKKWVSIAVGTLSLFCMQQNFLEFKQLFDTQLFSCYT